MNKECFPIYSEFAGDEEIGEIIILYAEEMPDRAARLQAELDAENWDRLQELSHQIKGSAGSHGFPMVSRAAAHLNNLIKNDGFREQIVEAAEKLIDMCLRTTGEIKP